VAGSLGLKVKHYAVLAFLSLTVSSPAPARAGDSAVALAGVRNSASDMEVLKRGNEEAL
jgi:hypothetical protein